MQFTTKPFIDETIVQQRIQTLIAEYNLFRDTFSLDGVTVVAATPSSIQFANLFSAAFRFRGIESIVLTAGEDPSSKWLVDNESSWLASCLTLQDVTSTGHI